MAVTKAAVAKELLPGSKGRAQSKVFERLQTSATLRGSKKTTRLTWSCVLRILGGRHGRGFDRGAAPNLVLSVRAIFNRSNRKLCVPFLGPGSGPQRTPRREVPAKRLVLSCPCERRRPQQRGRPMSTNLGTYPPPLPVPMGKWGYAGTCAIGSLLKTSVFMHLCYHLCLSNTTKNP